MDGSKFMKAAIRRSGGIIFQPFHETPKYPSPGTDEVLIRVRAATINPIDYKMPKILLGTVVGLDMAGVIEAVAEGENKHGFKVGDSVWGSAKGALAEFVIANASRIAHLPKDLSFVQAAAMPVTYITGFQGLRRYGKLRPGGRVLIIGASGGCGTAAIQLAKAFEASEIVGVCSGKNAEAVKEYGATAVINYQEQNFADIYGKGNKDNKFDVVYDAASSSGKGENYRSESFKVLRPGGQYVPINGTMIMWLRLFCKFQAANTNLFLADVNTKDLKALAELAADGLVKPIIAETLPFTGQAVKIGFGWLRGRRTVGKIVFDMTLPSPPCTDEVIVVHAGWWSLSYPMVGASVAVLVAAGLYMVM